MKNDTHNPYPSFFIHLNSSKNTLCMAPDANKYIQSGMKYVAIHKR